MGPFKFSAFEVLKIKHANIKSRQIKNKIFIL